MAQQRQGTFRLGRDQINKLQRQSSAEPGNAKAKHRNAAIGGEWQRQCNAMRCKGMAALRSAGQGKGDATARRGREMQSMEMHCDAQQRQSKAWISDVEQRL